MSLHEIKMLGLSIEEGANEAAKKAGHGGGQNFKAQYQRYVFDFFKETAQEDGQGGFTEKITLPNIGASAGSKKSRLQLNYYAVAFGASIEVEYNIVEANGSSSVLNVVLNSGDAFVANSNVKSISYQVKSTTSKYHDHLVMREGCLLLQAERD